HPDDKDELTEPPRHSTDLRRGNQERDRDRNFDRDRESGRANPNPDLTSQEVTSMDRFLDQHPDVARDLRRNPDLVNDNNYLHHQHDMDTCLDANPAVKDES